MKPEKTLAAFYSKATLQILVYTAVILIVGMAAVCPGFCFDPDNPWIPTNEELTSWGYTPDEYHSLVRKAYELLKNSTN